ncbi:MAG: helix-turn-helix transcriptional regulator [Alphaproteobacteria bacterium]|nr:helix-turn-helix transcriptional regulator [Alphaproteobacteria bacterium]
MPKNLTDKLTAEFKKNLKTILDERAHVTNAKKLSIEAGLGETAVRDILKNRSVSPKLETIQKLAKALHVPVYRLIPSMIDHSYDQLAQQEEEIQLLREASGLDYMDLNELKAAVEKRKKTQR